MVCRLRSNFLWQLIVKSRWLMVATLQIAYVKIRSNNGKSYGAMFKASNRRWT